MVRHWVLTIFNLRLLAKHYRQSNETNFILFNAKTYLIIINKISNIKIALHKSCHLYFLYSWRILSINLCSIYTSTTVISSPMFSFNSGNICGLLMNAWDLKKPHLNRSGDIKSREYEQAISTLYINWNFLIEKKIVFFICYKIKINWRWFSMKYHWSSLCVLTTKII